MENKSKSEVIDLREVAKKIWAKRRLFYIVWAITFVVACVIILPVPRTYFSEVTVAPEMSGGAEGTLGSIASSFGFNLGDMQSDDAFYPDIYPDIIATNGFIVDLLKVQIETEDGDLKTDYYTYLRKHQKTTFYLAPFIWLRKHLTMLFDKGKTNAAGGDAELDPFRLTKDQDALFEVLRNTISCSVDKKTGIITISVVDQDPLVCATIADSVRVHLQDFITKYRTNKARIDMEYYEKLTNNAKIEYEEAVKRYSQYVDANRNVILQAYISERDEIENDMERKLTTYNAMTTQLEAAKARVQESTPAFTLLQASSVPVRPYGPKRMIFIVGMLFLVSIGTVLYIFRTGILNQILGKNV